MLGLGLSIGAAQTLPLARYKIGGKAPAAVADYSAGVYGLDGRAVTFDGLFDFARLSAAWKLNALGHWVKALAGEPRTGHHIWQGGKLVPAGMAICSEVRTNLLLNSDTLSTQSVTVSAVEHTLSFTGTGTVTLSGASTDGPLVGTGTGEGNRVSLSFTPSAGSLTMTVSGDVQNAQLEAGPYATDYISTEGAQVSTASESLEIDPVKVAKAVGVQGPELVTNGDFSGPGDWTLLGAATIADGVGRTNSGGGWRQTGVGLSPGVVCIVEFDIVRYAAGSAIAFVGSTSSGATRSAIGSYSELITVSGTDVVQISTGGGSDLDIDNVSIRQVTMPEALTFLMNGTMTRAKDPESYINAAPFRWEADSNNYTDMVISTNGSHVGRPYFRSKKDGVTKEEFGAFDALDLGVEIPFSLGFVLSATEIEGFYNGVSTGKTTHGGMANLLASPLQIFPVGSATLKDFRLWFEALPSADLLEATA
jgi:hypothetical protein